ncbi:uncharacterized protein PAC_12516 [Phialocephala subalpina]|uniref:Clr5 domain-containing protein n=1 Tax=Phialocephala subalpina TaxID=576137 RepID=A0A1L7XC63_9HELO|nr:uncharacterized protein PAC_12516 [Phialocephala subalpina]
MESWHLSYPGSSGLPSAYNPASNLLEQSAPLFSSHTVLPPTARPNVPRKYTAEDWIVQKSEITKLYNGNSLKLVRELMREHHGLDATAKQYQDRITKWGLDKNIKTTEMEAMIRKEQERALMNKPSAFRVRKRPVSQKKIDRYKHEHPEQLDSTNDGDIDMNIDSAGIIDVFAKPYCVP